jgi:hypothetical protein
LELSAGQNLEQQAIARDNQEVQFVAVVKFNLRMQTTIRRCSRAANAAAVNLQAVAQTAT